MVMLNICYIIFGIYYFDLTKNYMNLLKRSDITVCSAINMDTTINICKATSFLSITFACIMLFYSIINFFLKTEDLNIDVIVTFITFVQVILVCIFSANIFFIVFFTDEYYFSSCYVIHYKDIEQVEYIKTIHAYEGDLNLCVIHMKNGIKCSDKFFDNELKMLKTKISSLS